ncbi:MAG: tetratricopeptide repeat protein [Rhodospirillales bacterium]|nr:tetratricopeptide repeat protein [Rhodospirillales bacterium]
MADKTPERDPEQENLFKEIDEELRQEKMTVLWKKYGTFIIGAAVLVVCSVAAFQAWQAWDTNRRNAESAQFETALDAALQQRPADALETFAKLAKNGSTGYATLARLNQAGLQAEGGDRRGAVASYLSISIDDSVDTIFRDLALLLSTLHDLDTAAPDELAQRVARLALTDNPWRHSAKELSALLAQRKGDRSQAEKLFQELADDVTAPAGIRARAAEMRAILENSS